MVLRQIIPLLLLTVLHGVHCAGLRKANCNCSEETHQCGENLTVTHTPLYPVKDISLKYDNTTLFYSKEKEGSEENERFSINWTETNVMVTIFRFKFSDQLKYTLYLNEGVSITPTIFGICEPEITENHSTNDLECEAESEHNASIVWKLWLSNNTRLSQTTGVIAEELSVGYKLRSTLNMTEANKYEMIGCSVSYTMDNVTTEKMEKTSCVTKQGTSGWKNSTCEEVNKMANQPGDQVDSSALMAHLILLAVGVAAIVYLLKRKNPIRITRMRRLLLFGKQDGAPVPCGAQGVMPHRSSGVLMEEAPEEQNTTEQETV